MPIKHTLLPIKKEVYLIVMVQKTFAQTTVATLQNDPSIIGIAAGGSWISNEIDEFSDLDLIIITTQTIGGNKDKMLQFAAKLGTLLNAFTGEHVGEPRLLICLYKNPLLHVDIKFLLLDEFRVRIENPTILFERDRQLSSIIQETTAQFPLPDFQWIEDRFWIWMHYAIVKIQRGELLEATDFFAYIRMQVFSPLLHIKNGSLPRAVRKVEFVLPKEDLNQLLRTIPSYNKPSLLQTCKHSIQLYRHLREFLYPATIQFQRETEIAVEDYLNNC